jgi:hypothetical protein
VVGAVATRVEALGAQWDNAVAVHLYSAHDLAFTLVRDVLSERKIVPAHGINWHDAAPPVELLELEIDVRRYGREITISGSRMGSQQRSTATICLVRTPASDPPRRAKRPPRIRPPGVCGTPGGPASLAPRYFGSRGPRPFTAVNSLAVQVPAVESKRRSPPRRGCLGRLVGT